MKKLTILLIAILFISTNAFAVPVSIMNLSNTNATMTGGYDAHVYLGVRDPGLNCINDQAFYFLLTPNQSLVFSGQTAMAGTCLQDYLWGIPCSNTTYDQIFPGLRFWVQQGTFPGAQPVANQEYIAGVTRDLHCHPDHEYLIWTSTTTWEIKNNPTSSIKLSFIDLGFLKQYVFY